MARPLKPGNSARGALVSGRTAKVMRCGLGLAMRLGSSTGHEHGQGLGHVMLSQAAAQNVCL